MNLNMKYKFFLGVICSLMLGVLLSSCEDDESSIITPYIVTIDGVTEVTPNTTETYSIGDMSDGVENYSWSITGPGTIDGETSGKSIDVTFTGVGEVVLTVTNGTDSGTRTITVDEVSPGVTVSLNGYGKLKSGDSDTVYFAFDAPVASIGDYELTNGIGSIGTLTKIDDSNYYLIFTAGDTEGVSELYIDTLTSTETYGSAGLDSVYLDLYEVDNTLPIAALTYSELVVNDSTIVTVTATFSEEIDSVAFISFSGAGVEAETDTLQTTSDALVYTYEYVVNGGGNGTVTVSLDVQDQAGNELGGVSGASLLTVDNTAPVIIMTVEGGTGVATLDVTSSEIITGSYVIVASGDDGPEDASDLISFSDAVASGSLEFSTLNDEIPVSLTAGDYDVYFVGMDEAGNYSSLSTASVSVD